MKIIIFLSLLLLLPLVSAKCFPDYICNDWTNCSEGFQTRTCEDIKCNQRDITERKLCVDVNICTPDIFCNDWTECIYTEKSEDILQGRIKFGGFRERLCEDLNKCVKPFVELSNCESELKPTIKKIKEFGIDFLATLDARTKKPTTKINLDSWKTNRLDISLTQSTRKFPPSCYNLIKDNDEERIDCGGLCKLCRPIKVSKLPQTFSYIFWIISAIFGFLIVKEIMPEKHYPSRVKQNFNTIKRYFKLK